MALAFPVASVKGAPLELAYRIRKRGSANATQHCVRRLSFHLHAACETVPQETGGSRLVSTASVCLGLMNMLCLNASIFTLKIVGQASMNRVPSGPALAFMLLC